MVATFDYKGFAKDLTKQAECVMPQDIALKYKKEFLDKIYNYTYVAGEAFSKDETIENSDTAKVLTQIISEWTFHKYVDLLRSGIPDIYHESILQKLAYVAFEMTKESALSKLSNDEMLKLVEVQLNKAYEKSCRHLLENGQISQAIFDKAMSLSSVDTTGDDLNKSISSVNNMGSEKMNKSKSTVKFTVVALLLALVTVLLNIFYVNNPKLIIYNLVAIILLSVYIGFYFGANKYSK